MNRIDTFHRTTFEIADKLLKPESDLASFALLGKGDQLHIVECPWDFDEDGKAMFKVAVASLIVASGADIVAFVAETWASTAENEQEMAEVMAYNKKHGTIAGHPSTREMVVIHVLDSGHSTVFAHIIKRRTSAASLDTANKLSGGSCHSMFDGCFPPPEIRINPVAIKSSNEILEKLNIALPKW